MKVTLLLFVLQQAIIKHFADFITWKKKSALFHLSVLLVEVSEKLADVHKHSI